MLWELYKNDTMKIKIIYKTLYGFEFGEDLSVFDKIIETDNLNAKQVLEIAKSTVRKFFDAKTT